MKIFVLTLSALILFGSRLSAQTEKKPDFKIEGQIVVATNGKAGFFTLGGPSLKFSFAKFAFGINMIPSLKFEDDKPKPMVIPILGFGPQFYFFKDKRFVLSFPCYYYSSKNTWTISAGAGYVLTKPK